MPVLFSLCLRTQHITSKSLTGTVSQLPIPLTTLPRNLPRNLSRWISTHHHPDSLDRLLRNSATLYHIKQVHAQLLLSPTSNDSPFLFALIISFYSRFGQIFDARKVFDTCPSVSAAHSLFWNSIIRAHVVHENYQDALHLFVKMRERGVFGDGFTFPLVLRACALLGCLRLFRIVHGHVLEMEFGSHLHVGNELVWMYTKLGRMEDARNVLDKMSVRTHVSWNSLVSGYALNGDCVGALEVVRRMESHGMEPNVVTWVSLMSSHARAGRNEETLELFVEMGKRGIGVNAEALAVVLSVCSDLGAFGEGLVVHGCVVKGGFERYLFVTNALIGLHGKLGDVNDARKLFVEIENKNAVSWNALLTSYVDAGFCDEALQLLLEMQKGAMLTPNVVSWSAVINGFAYEGRGEESLELFRQMQLDKVMASAITISTVLSVCSELAALNLGREIHGHVIRASMDSNILAQNGLVNMYTKCGRLREGRWIFENIQRKDRISWNSLIAGYGMHGMGVDALEAFDQMIKSGFDPDGVTFVAVLSACSHAGLVSEGRRLFKQMRGGYKIEPQMEHYACMVDLLGRAGLLQEATKIINEMPMEPNICVWGALLNSCRTHRDMEVAAKTAPNISMDSSKPTGSYMLLSNIYAANGRWDDSARVRASARTKGIKKSPGQSWIEVKGKVFMCSAGDDIQYGMEVYGVLGALVAQMECESYVTDNNVILQSVHETNQRDDAVITL